MDIIYIEKLNASFIKICNADIELHEEINLFFKYKQPNFYKRRGNSWDGTIFLYNKKKGILQQGLLQFLIAFLQERNISFKLDSKFKEEITEVNDTDLDNWIKELDISSNKKSLQLFDYQFEALKLAIKYNKLTLLAATSSGKSLIIYLLIRYYELLEGRTLIIVPSIFLVSQLYDDFNDYSYNLKWGCDKYVQTICEGSTKIISKNIVIATWQSLQYESPEYFEQFTNLIVDEVHHSKASKITKICKYCINAERRIGLTGTLDNIDLHQLQVIANFGPVKNIVNSKKLRDMGIATNTQIYTILLDYLPEDRYSVSLMDYRNEIEFLINHDYRNFIIKNLASYLKGNSLFLFARIDGHLKIIKDQLDKMNIQNKRIFVISGEVSVQERNEIKQCIEKSNDIILLASYKTLSTGVSIKKLHNMVFCHPVKSFITVVQSIGRILRLHDTKEIANIYDFIDDLSYGERNNITLEHGKSRLETYKLEQHDFKIKKIEVKELYKIKDKALKKSVKVR